MGRRWEATTRDGPPQKTTVQVCGGILGWTGEGGGGYKTGNTRRWVSGIKDVVKRQTEWAQQLKEKEEEKTTMLQLLQSLFSPTNTIPFLRKSRRRREHQSEVEHMQTLKEADRLFERENKLKAQQLKEKHIQFNCNASLAAERRARLQQQKWEEAERRMQDRQLRAASSAWEAVK